MYFSPTEQLFLLCIRREPDVLKAKKLLESKINWFYFTNLAIFFHLAPLIYYHLSKISSFFTKIERLKKIYYQNIFQNIIYEEEIEKILKEFDLKNIKVIVLKGTYLAKLLYDNISLRTINDIDLLIQLQDIDKAKETIFNLGYSILEKPFSEEFYRNFHTHFHCIKKKENFQIFLDLHFQLTKPYDPFNIDMKEIWQEASFENNKNIAQLEISDLLLYLCLHYRQHGYIGLKPLADFVGFIEKFKEKICWPKVLEKAKRYKITNILLFCLYLTYEFFDLEVGINKKELKKYKKGLFHFFIYRFMIFRILKKKLIKRIKIKENIFCFIFFQFILLGYKKDIIILILRRFFPSYKELSLRYKTFFARMFHPFLLISKLKRF